MRAEPADLDSLLGERYLLERLLASGGMAQVWVARDQVLDRPVALKLLHPRFAADRAFVARFRREAVAAARVNHPNIVAIFDTCSDGEGREAIVMELVDGHDLRHELDERGPLPLNDVLLLGADVAGALSAAHEAGVIHRDIKPANILLASPADASGRRVLVTDFGIAKAFDGGAPLTQTGMILGTARYLAPEQVSGHPVDARTDLYALGAVLYEALAGRPAFSGEGDLATAMSRLHRDPVPLHQFRTDVPRSVEAIVARAMARDPDDRFRSADELRANLLAALRNESAATTLPAPEPASAAEVASYVRRERRWLIPTAVLVLAALLLGGAGLTFGRTATEDLFDRALDVVKPAPSPGTSETTTPPQADVLQVRQVRSFDPQGTDGEHDETLSLLVDGKTSTTWSTERYDDAFPKLKEGVGFILQLEQPVTLDQLVLTSPAPGWRAEIYVADKVQDDLSGWGDPVKTVDGDSDSITTSLDGAQGAAVLVWLVALPPSSEQVGRFQGEFSGVELRGSG